jgi:hypothetical protein
MRLKSLRVKLIRPIALLLLSSSLPSSLSSRLYKRRKLRRGMMRIMWNKEGFLGTFFSVSISVVMVPFRIGKVSRIT